MKSKFLFVMSVAATMLLASCNNMPAESSQPAASESTSATQGQVLSISCEQTEATLQLNETLQLNVTVEVSGGASNKAVYSSSNPDVATVKDTGLVTAKAVGDAVITIKAKADESKTCSVTIHVAAVQYDAISGLTAGVAATVKGTCIAVNTKSFILADETGAVMVYLNNKPSQEIGKVYTAKGTPVASAYSAGFTQFDSNAVIEEVTGETAMVPTATELTAEIANGWLTAYNAATDKTAQYLTQDAMKLYKWETTVTMSGTYAVIKVAGSDLVIEPVYMDNKAFTLEEGKKYNVEGVYAGYRVPSSGGGYAQIVITKAEEKAAEVGDVSIASAEDARVVKIDADLEMTASIYGVEGQSVTWSLKEEGADQLATITPDNENGNKAMLHGKAVGKVTVVATYLEKSAEMEITIESNAVDKTISQLNTLDEVVNLDVVVAGLGYQGYVIADATGHVFVYDRTNTPAVGDHLKLEAKVGARNGGMQLTVNKYEVATEGTVPTAPAAMAMTEEVGVAMAAAAKAAKGNNTFMQATEQMPIGLYKFENVLISGSGNYLMWDVGNAHFETANTADANKPVSGKNYDLEGVVYASYTGNNMDYVTVVVIKAEEHAAEAGTVSIEGPSAVNVGDSIELEATVAGGGNVSWTFADGTTTSDYATLVPGNDNKVAVTGVAAGNIVVKATCGDKSAEHAVQVKAVEAGTITVSKTSAALATELNWTASAGSDIGTNFKSGFALDEHLTVSFEGTGNTGTYWTSGSNIRVYGTKELSDASVTITAAAGYEIKTVALTFELSNSPTFPLTSGVAATVNAGTVTYTMTSGAKNGQLKITAFEVVYAVANA